MNHRFGKLMLRACSIVALVLPSSGVAQTVQPPPSPRDRPRPEFDPVGGRIGNFMLHPKLDVDLEFNDNIFAADEGADGDFILRARPALNVERRGSRSRWSLETYLSRSVFLEHGTENALEGGIKTDGTVDISRRSGLRVSLAYDNLAQERFNISSPTAAAERVRYGRLAGQASYTHDLDPLRLRGDLRATRLDFSDVRSRTGAVLDQDFRDALFVSASAAADYQVSPGVAALARVTVDRLDFRTAVRNGVPFDRDSTGLKAEAGISLELSRLLFGEVRAGYLRRDSAAGTLGKITGLSYGASLTWTATPLTTMRLFADREVEEGGAEITAGNLRSEVMLSVEHELLRSLVLEASARYAQIKPLGPLPTASEYDVEAKATYYVSRRLRLFGSLRHFQREASGFFTEFRQRRAMLGVRLVW